MRTKRLNKHVLKNNIDINNVIMGRVSMGAVQRSISTKFGFYIDKTNIFNLVVVNKVLSFDDEKQKLFFREIAGLYWEMAQDLFKKKNEELMKNVWQTSD